MTDNAREVLGDCQKALIEYDLIDLHGRWRFRWITCVVLLRVVGHVLKEVDGKKDRALKEAINAAAMAQDLQ